MRVTTAFNRLLRLPAAAVIDVSFSAEGVIVSVRLRRRRRVCARCGQTGQRLVVHDRRVKRWRHLDLGRARCVLECELRLLRCPDCRVVRAEPVPWAHITRATSEDVVAWLAQQMAKTPICGLLRIGWDSVGQIVARVVADDLDESRLAGLTAIGVDEMKNSCNVAALRPAEHHTIASVLWSTTDVRFGRSGST